MSRVLFPFCHFPPVRWEGYATPRARHRIANAGSASLSVGPGRFRACLGPATTAASRGLRPRRWADYPVALRTSDDRHHWPGRVGRPVGPAKQPAASSPSRGPLGQPRRWVPGALPRAIGHLSAGPAALARLLGGRIPRSFPRRHRQSPRRLEHAQQPVRPARNLWPHGPTSGFRRGGAPLDHLLRRLPERLPGDGALSDGRKQFPRPAPHELPDGRTPRSGKNAGHPPALVERLAECFGCDRYHLYTGHPLLRTASRAG